MVISPGKCAESPSAQPFGAMRAHGIERRELPAGMHAGIGSARAAHFRHVGIHRADRAEQLSGDRARTFLHGPP